MDIVPTKHQEFAPISLEPVFIVTGANGAIGYGICLRLLVQVALSVPIDIFANHSKASKGVARISNPLTLYMACRNQEKAEIAKKRLLQDFASYVKRSAIHKDYVDAIMRGLTIIPAAIDLSNPATIFTFASKIKEKHAYVTHLIFNAGIAPFIGVDPVRATKDMCFHPIKAMTSPQYVIQSTGTLSPDGVGMIFITNTFGHYILYKLLLGLLKEYGKKSGSRARVIWMSTLSAGPEYYDPNDLQLLKNNRSYEGSKYQMDLIAAHYNENVRESHHPKHFTVQPGIIPTNLDKPNSRAGWSTLRAVALSSARALGSKNHPSSPYKGAVSAVHASLVPVETLPSGPVKINSHTKGFSGREYVTYSEYVVWNEEEKRKAEELVTRLDELYEAEVASYSSH